MVFLRFLRSPGLALGTLLFLALFALLSAWLPALPGPVWLGLDHPFSSGPFLGACGLLFLNTLACIWDRTARVARLTGGTVPPGAVSLEGGDRAAQETFLRARGFSGQGERLFRFRAALWGGWVLHLGLLALMAGVLVQQGFHDEGTFLLTEGGRIHLAAPEAVFGRSRGPLAPAQPPDIEVVLLSFDPALHQRGYAPDRASRLRLTPAGGSAVEAAVDRASGVSVEGVTVYQAIPTGVALVLERPGVGLQSLHLRGEGRTAEAEVRDPSGQHARFTAEGERDLDDPSGTGPLALALSRGGETYPLVLGQPFLFGGAPAKPVAVARWASFTYARSPGMPAVFAGFILVLAGSALLAFPAGVARWDGEAGAFRVYLARGAEALAARWHSESGT